MKKQALPLDVEIDLVRRAQAGDLAARDILFEQFYPLMWRFALRERSPQVEASEVMQHCYLAFERSLKLFDLDRETPVRFITYLYTSISRGIRRSDILPSLVRLPEGNQSQVFSLDAASDGDASILSRLSSDLSDRDSRLVEHMDQWQRVRKAINSLSPREKRIIKLRLKSLTLQDIGERLGVSKERVRQLEGRALRRIRSILNAVVPR